MVDYNSQRESQRMYEIEEITRQREKGLYDDIEASREAMFLNERYQVSD